MAAKALWTRQTWCQNLNGLMCCVHDWGDNLPTFPRYTWGVWSGAREVERGDADTELGAKRMATLAAMALTKEATDGNAD